MKVGSINGSPLEGLCYRVCVEVKRIYDGCQKKYDNLMLTLPLSSFSGASTPPLTFISVESVGNASISNLVVTPVANSERYIIDYDYTLPLLVRFNDASGLTGSASSSITLHNTVRLRLPAENLVPYTIEVWARLFGRIGSFNATESVTVQCCLTVITKVVFPIDLLIPSYGYCKYPDCEADSVICPGFSDSNIFPPL